MTSYKEKGDGAMNEIKREYIVDACETSKKLRFLLETEGVSVTYLAEIMKISQQAVYKWINPQSSSLPEISHLVTLSKVLGRNIEDLLVFYETNREENCK